MQVGREAGPAVARGRLGGRGGRVQEQAGGQGAGFTSKQGMRRSTRASRHSVHACVPLPREWCQPTRPAPNPAAAPLMPAHLVCQRIALTSQLLRVPCYPLAQIPPAGAGRQGMGQACRGWGGRLDAAQAAGPLGRGGAAAASLPGWALECAPAKMHDLVNATSVHSRSVLVSSTGTGGWAAPAVAPPGRGVLPSCSGPARLGLERPTLTPGSPGDPLLVLRLPPAAGPVGAAKVEHSARRNNSAPLRSHTVTSSVMVLSQARDAP